MKRCLYLLFFCVIGLVEIPSDLEARLYFFHVPKTGGTTMRLLLEKQLSTQEIYPYKNDLSGAIPVNDAALVSGHFKYSFCKKIDPDFDEAFKVTILRDPVERYLSYLRWRKRTDLSFPDLESVLRARHSKNQTHIEGLVDNALCRYLAEDPQLEGEDLLESAKQTLHRMDCVIFLENFTEDVIALFKRLEIDLDPGEIPKINTTQKEPVSAAVLEEVIRLNEWDSQLYQYAKTYIYPKDTQYPFRTSSYADLLETTTSIDYTFDLPLNGRGWGFRDIEAIDNKRFPIYRWVMDKPAEIYFSLETGVDYIFTFNAFSLAPDVIPRVKVNGTEIEVYQKNNQMFSLYKGIVPKELITTGPTQITFYSTTTHMYSDRFPKKHNRNFAPLSFAVNRIQLLRQL
jgi:hypothetical protein